MGVTELVFYTYPHLKIKLKGVFIGYTVAMVNYYVK